MKARRAGFLPAALSLLLLPAGCSPSEGQSTATDATPSPARDARKVNVRTEIIEPRPFRDVLETTALLEAWDEVTPSTEFGGFVREVNFEKGERVRSGQVLARIGDDLAEAQLEQAKAELLAADANFTKVSKLVERQALPQQDLVAATSRRDNAAARVREMEIRLDRAVVRAPMAGVAFDRAVEPGEVVAPGQRITTLQRIDKLKAAVQLPDTEIGWLADGREAYVTVDAFPGARFDARLSYVAPAADPDTRTFLVEFALDDGRGRLRPGLVGRVAVVRRVVEDALVIPTDALVARRGGFVAFVVRDCRAEERVVRMGPAEGDRVFVEEGLDRGDELVIAGQADLVDGHEVRSENCP